MGRWRRPTQRWPGPCSHEAGPLLPPPHLLNSRGPLAWNPHTQTGPSRAGLSCPFAATGRPPCRTGRRDPAALGRRHGVNLGPRPPASRPPNPGVGPVTPLHTHTHTHTHVLGSSSPATCPFHPGTGKVTKGTCPGPASAFPLSHPGMQFDEPTLLR